MRPLRPIAFALALLPALALAQWQWLDKDGRKVFSDRPPPADVPASKIITRPRNQSVVVEQAAAATPAASAASSAASAAKPAGSAPALTGKDKALEEKKKQAEAAEAAKKKAEEEKFAQAKADNCARAKRSRAAFDSGVRIARTNEKGEREVLDDKQRAEEITVLDGIIARDCKAQ